MVGEFKFREYLVNSIDLINALLLIEVGLLFGLLIQPSCGRRCAGIAL